MFDSPTYTMLTIRQGLEDATTVQVQSRGFYYHRPDRTAQTAFNRLMLDERQRVGQLIKQWMTLLRDALKVVNMPTPAALSNTVARRAQTGE